MKTYKQFSNESFIAKKLYGDQFHKLVIKAKKFTDEHTVNDVLSGIGIKIKDVVSDALVSFNKSKLKSFFDPISDKYNKLKSDANNWNSLSQNEKDKFTKDVNTIFSIIIVLCSLLGLIAIGISTHNDNLTDKEKIDKMFKKSDVIFKDINGYISKLGSAGDNYGPNVSFKGKPE